MTALVMELVEGEDLSQRMSRGRIPFDEALPIARQIAEALEAAHECGIIHRDLKPANVKVRADGAVKVLDFGSAKSVPQAWSPTSQADENLANSPTLSIHATEAGIILGAAAYMSPEQAAGQAVDKRSDLWAFGVVLLEMLTGRPAFGGETVSHVLAAVLKDEPGLTALPSETPDAIRRLLRRCLTKDRKHRLPDAATARLEIDDASSESPRGVGQIPARRPSRREQTAWGLASILALAVVVLAMRGITPAPLDAPATRFSIAPPGGWTFASTGSGRTGWGSPVVVSPDGRYIAMVAAGADGTQHLWLRTLDATVPQLLEGTGGASGPFWSPDSRWIAFFSSGKLKRVATSGRELQVLCDSGAGGGGTWNQDDVILFAPTSAGEGGLFKVPGGGGFPTAVTTLDASRSEANHLWPQFLPDGRHYLYVIGSRDDPGLYVGALDSKDRTKLLGLAELGDEYSRVEYVASGHLLFVRNRALLAQPFNAEQLSLTGGVTQIADNVLKEGPGSSAFSASNNGVLVFWGGAAPPPIRS